MPENTARVRAKDLSIVSTYLKMLPRAGRTNAAAMKVKNDYLLWKHADPHINYIIKVPYFGNLPENSMHYFSIDDLLFLLRSVPGTDEEVRINLEDNKLQLELQSNRYSTKRKIEEITEEVTLPFFKINEIKNFLAINKNLALRILRKAAVFPGNSTMSDVLTGSVIIAVTDGKISVFSTDGYAAYSTFNINAESNAEDNVIAIPKSEISALIKHIEGHKEENIDFKISGNFLIIDSTINDSVSARVIFRLNSVTVEHLNILQKLFPEELLSDEVVPSFFMHAGDMETILKDIAGSGVNDVIFELYEDTLDVTVKSTDRTAVASYSFKNIQAQQKTGFLLYGHALSKIARALNDTSRIAVFEIKNMVAFVPADLSDRKEIFITLKGNR